MVKFCGQSETFGYSWTVSMRFMYPLQSRCVLRLQGVYFIFLRRARSRSRSRSRIHSQLGGA